jgi:hypothetical protein
VLFYPEPRVQRDVYMARFTIECSDRYLLVRLYILLLLTKDDDGLSFSD